MDIKPIRKYDGSDGCIVPGHWGQYGTAMVVTLARDYGFSDMLIVPLAELHMHECTYPHRDLLTDEAKELLSESDDNVVSWLNTWVAMPGFQFGWYDGEFFYMTDEWWLS